MKFLVILEDTQKKRGQVTLVGRSLSSTLLAAGHDVNVFDFQCFSEMFDRMDDTSAKERQSLDQMKSTLNELLVVSHAVLYLTFKQNFPSVLGELIGRDESRDRYRWSVQGVNCLLLGAHARSLCAAKLIWQLLLQVEYRAISFPVHAHSVYPESSHLEESALPMV